MSRAQARPSIQPKFLPLSAKQTNSFETDNDALSIYDVSVVSWPSHVSMIVVVQL
jgi:hypothetical protein